MNSSNTSLELEDLTIDLITGVSGTFSNVNSTNEYRINDTSVLTSDTLGSGIVNSVLEVESMKNNHPYLF